jgi:hypothetical protein
MRRILLALLICLLPLQSFAGLAMSTKMAGMESSMSMAMAMATSTTDAAQAPCHEALQPDAADSQDCCGLQGVCQAMCHVVFVPMTAIVVFHSAPAAYISSAYAAAYQSADVRLGLKPPLL